MAGTRVALAVALGAVVAASAMAQTTLRYRVRPGEDFAYLLSQRTAPPTLSGAQPFRTDLRYDLTGGERGRLRVRISGRSTRGEIDVQPSEGRLVLGERGLTGVRGAQLEDPIQGAFLKALTSYLVQLPDHPVRPGDAWQVEGAFHAPKLSLPGSFSQQDSLTVVTFEGPREVGGRVLMALTFTSREVEGAERKVRIQGTALVDPMAQRVVHLRAAGRAETKVSLLFTESWFRTPVSIELVEERWAPVFVGEAGLVADHPDFAAATQGPRPPGLMQADELVDRMQEDPEDLWIDALEGLDPRHADGLASLAMLVP